MARKKGVTGTIIQVQRELERQQRQLEKAERDAERARKAAIRERARQHAEARLEEAEVLQDELEDRIEELTTILEVGLQGDAVVDVDDLKEQWTPEPFNPGRLGVHRPRPQVSEYEPRPLRGLAKMLPGAQAKHERLVGEEQARFVADKARWQTAEDQRMAELERLRADHQAQVESERERVARQHARVSTFLCEWVWVS